MAKTTLCCECHYWLDMEKELDKPFGQCDHPSIEDKIIIEKTQSMMEDAVIYTHKHFGCIYNSPKHRNIITQIDPDSIDDDN